MNFGDLKKFACLLALLVSAAPLGAQTSDTGILGNRYRPQWSCNSGRDGNTYPTFFRSHSDSELVSQW